MTRLMKQVHRQFVRRGFTINYDQGKTSAVLTFVGSGAPELRKTHLLQDRPGVLIDFEEEGYTRWLHFTAKYKHLGAFFSASHSFEPEMRQRIGMARAAFQKTLRAVLGNRHYPLKLRMQFFQSLVCSRFFFGMGAWATPTLQQLARLRIEFHKMLRTILRCEAGEQLSNAQLLIQTDALDVRVRIATDRLLYARKLFQIGPSFLQQLLHLEHALCPTSWIASLQADLQWLQRLVPDELAPIVDGDLTQIVEMWQTDALPWKRILRRALRKHRVQEQMMYDVHTFHEDILATLKQAGATFEPDLDALLSRPREALHKCSCGRAFTTSQGLALHRRSRPPSSCT